MGFQQRNSRGILYQAVSAIAWMSDQSLPATDVLTAYLKYTSASNSLCELDPFILAHSSGVIKDP